MIVVGVIAGIAWYLHARHYESTDDAFIDGRPVLVSPQVTGNIISVNVTDNQIVKKGDLLATIDARNYKAAVDQADAQIRQNEATVKNFEAQIAAQKAQVDQATQQVTEARRRSNSRRTKTPATRTLFRREPGPYSARNRPHPTSMASRPPLTQPNAAKVSAERQIEVLNAQRIGAAAQLDQARAQKDRADADLQRTELRATVDGRVTKLTAAVGALAAPGQAIMVIVPLEVWVTANFKESQLADMRVGQPVDIRIDAFGGRIFPGQVDSVQAGSGTAFSLLPAENATGNYVKVVQRVPVKITFNQRPRSNWDRACRSFPPSPSVPERIVACLDAAKGEYGDANPWIIAVLVAIATFMEVLDTTIANVALRYISGGLAVSSDEASWVITTYLVANSIVLCASGWIAEMFGRKSFFLVCIALFTASSLLCGFAWNCRLAGLPRPPGAGGRRHDAGGAINSGRSFPAREAQPGVRALRHRGRRRAGGRADTWRVVERQSVLALVLSHQRAGRTDLARTDLHDIPSSPEKKKERERLWAKGLNFDLVGFLLIATFLGGLEVVLDRGQIDDWFGSSFIVTFAAISATALLLFIPWELNRPQPLIDIKMLTGRQFGTCFVIMLVTGALLIATTQILPQLLQEEFGYTATLAGLAISPGGAVTMVMMVVVGRLGFVQPRYLIAVGAAIACYAMVDLLRINPDSDYWYFAWSRIYLGIGLPLIFIPITTASYDGIPPDKTDQASALINLARNFGGSMGVALSQTVLARREQFHQSRLVEHLGSWNPFYNDTLNRIQEYLNGRAATGSSSGTSTAIINQIVQSQAAILAYIDVFVALAVIAMLMVPLALTLRTVNRSAGAKSAH